jgi:hypothetical protein
MFFERNQFVFIRSVHKIIPVFSKKHPDHRGQVKNVIITENAFVLFKKLIFHG